MGDVRPTHDQRARRVEALTRMGVLPVAAVASVPEAGLSAPGAAGPHPVHPDPDSIQLLRESRRSQTLDRLVGSHARTHVALSAAPGAAVLVEHELRNPLSADVTVAVRIADPQGDTDELQVVPTEAEWKALRAAQGHAGVGITPEPESLFAAGNRILLHPSERITVPLRFLCLSAAGPRARTIAVKFVVVATAAGAEQDCGAEIGELAVSVQPRLPSIDRTLRLEARAEETLRRRLVLPERAEAPARLWCSDETVAVSAAALPRTGGGAVDVRMRVGPAPQRREFLLVLSDDPYLARVRETWRVVVQARQWCDVRATVAQTGRTTLLLRVPGPLRRVRAYTSHPDLVQTDPLSEFDLASDVPTPLTLTYRPLAALQTDVLVNVVDVYDGTLVDAWAVSISTSHPIPSRIFDETVSRTRGERRRIALSNPYTERVAYQLRTDQPALLRFRDEHLTLQPGQTERIGLVFLPVDASVPPQQEVFVYVTDAAGGRVDECFAVRIKYVP